MQRKAKYWPRRANNYVPRCDYAADVMINAPHEVRFGPMIVATTADILAATSVAAAGVATLGGAVTLLKDNTDPVNAAVQPEFPYGPGFGRTLQVTLSGAGVAIIDIRGRDYLGQPMRESVTTAGAATIQGVKAFKYIDSITWPTIGAVNLTVGVGAKFGLPYRMENVYNENADGIGAAAGALVTPVLTDPQTAITGDPRGVYTPTTTPDGVKVIAAVFQPNRQINAAGNGGLFGLPHFFS